MDAALGKGQPPPQLVLAWRIQRWGASAVVGNTPLPYALLTQMATLVTIYDAVQYLVTKTGKTTPVSLRFAARNIGADERLSQGERDAIRELLKDGLL